MVRGWFRTRCLKPSTAAYIRGKPAAMPTAAFPKEPIRRLVPLRVLWAPRRPMEPRTGLHMAKLQTIFKSSLLKEPLSTNSLRNFSGLPRGPNLLVAVAFKF